MNTVDAALYLLYSLFHCPSKAHSKTLAKINLVKIPFNNTLLDSLSKLTGQISNPPHVVHTLEREPVFKIEEILCMKRWMEINDADKVICFYGVDSIQLKTAVFYQWALTISCQHILTMTLHVMTCGTFDLHLFCFTWCFFIHIWSASEIRKSCFQLTFSNCSFIFLTCFCDMIVMKFFTSTTTCN